MAHASQHDFQAPTKKLHRLIGILLLVAGGLFALPSQATEQLDLLPTNETFRFSTQDSYYEAREFTGNLNIKGLEISDGIYLRQLRISEDRGPGVVVEQGDYSLGLNQRGVEFLFKF
jgi:hypothetical protein